MKFRFSDSIKAFEIRTFLTLKRISQMIQNLFSFRNFQKLCFDLLNYGLCQIIKYSIEETFSEFHLFRLVQSTYECKLKLDQDK